MMDLFVSEEAVLVIGDGCSVRLQYPSWRELLERLTALAVEIATDRGVAFNPNPIQAREEPLQYAGSIKTFIHTCDGKLDKYYGLLSGEFRQRDVDYSFHQQLVKIPSRGILTTNYDPSLDVALELTDRSTTTGDRFLIIEDGSARLVSEFLASLNRGSAIARRIAHLHGRHNQRCETRTGSRRRDRTGAFPGTNGRVSRCPSFRPPPRSPPGRASAA
jgi:hypothetical protein